MPAAAVTVASGLVEEVLDGYRRYLVCERGAREGTFVRFEPDSRMFL